MLALNLDCSIAALTISQIVLPIWKLVELKLLDLGDCMITVISFLTSAADYCSSCFDTNGPLKLSLLHS